MDSLVNREPATRLNRHDRKIINEFWSTYLEYSAQSAESVMTGYNPDKHTGDMNDNNGTKNTYRKFYKT